MAIASEMKEMNLSQLRNLRPRTLHEALLFLWRKVKCNVDFLPCKVLLMMVLLFVFEHVSKHIGTGYDV